MLRQTILLPLIILMLPLMATGQGLYVGTYNIRYQNQGDYATGNGWTQRSPALCSLILFEHPDIFGAQEVLKEQLQDMKDQLTDYSCIGVGRDDGKSKGEHAPIFYDRHTVTLLRQGHFWLSQTPDSPGKGWDAACPRICTWGQFHSTTWGRTFYFFNLHMDHVGTQARRQSAILVLDKIRTIAQGQPVILTGDLNVDQNDETYHLFLSSGLLYDSYRHSRHRHAPNGTFNGFDPGRKTDSRIDHIFVSPGLQVQRYGILTTGYWTDSGLRLPSDHYPVFVRLE